MLRIGRHRSMPILHDLCTLRSRYLYLASAYMYFSSPIAGHCVPFDFGYSRQSNDRSNKRSPLKKQHPCDATRMFFQARFRLDTASVCRSMFVTESKEYRRAVRNRIVARLVSACSRSIFRGRDRSSLAIPRDSRIRLRLRNDELRQSIDPRVSAA